MPSIRPPLISILLQVVAVCDETFDVCDETFDLAPQRIALRVGRIALRVGRIELSTHRCSRNRKDEVDLARQDQARRETTRARASTSPSDASR
jgi:hypothetical protein